MKSGPVRRHMLLYQFDFLQSEIARLLGLESGFEDVQERNEIGRAHESISNMAAVIKVDLVNLLNSMDGLDLADDRVALVLGMLKRRRLRLSGAGAMPLVEPLNLVSAIVR
jgi:hypothetical protein